MKDHAYFVYVMASKRNGTIYVGVTNNVMRRAWEHQNDVFEGFTRKYGVHRLVWFEFHEEVHAAIAREKRIKKWNCAWKVALVEKDNPDWTDLHWRFKHDIDKRNRAFMESLERAAAAAKGSGVVHADPDVLSNQ